jgi:hypothetical protein
MSEYCPDRWVIIRIVSEDFGATDKVYSGNYGGYCGSDSWKMNSGITEIADKGEYYDITGLSGSVYKCYKEAEGMSNYMVQMLDHFRTLKSDKPYTIELVKIEDVKFCSR